MEAECRLSGACRGAAAAVFSAVPLFNCSEMLAGPLPLSDGHCCNINAAFCLKALPCLPRLLETSPAGSR